MCRPACTTCSFPDKLAIVERDFKLCRNGNDVAQVFCSQDPAPQGGERGAEAEARGARFLRGAAEAVAAGQRCYFAYPLSFLSQLLIVQINRYVMINS